MSLFRVLRGDSSRIDLSVTPFHDGWCYYCTDDNKFYIDHEDSGVQKRTCLNPDGVTPNWGAENAGKVLGISESGDVVLMDVSSAGGAMRWGDLKGQISGGD